MNNLVIQLLLTAATAGFSVIPVLADFNRTHATNPDWDAHARFHVVWQISSYVGAAFLNLYLIWSDSGDVEKLLLATGLAASMYAGFFTAVFARHLYAGALYNINGYPPFKLHFVKRDIMLEPNIAVFSAIVAIFLCPAACLLLWGRY